MVTSPMTKLRVRQLARSVTLTGAEARQLVRDVDGTVESVRDGMHALAAHSERLVGTVQGLSDSLRRVRSQLALAQRAVASGDPAAARAAFECVESILASADRLTTDTQVVLVIAARQLREKVPRWVSHNA